MAVRDKTKDTPANSTMAAAMANAGVMGKPEKSPAAPVITPAPRVEKPTQTQQPQQPQQGYKTMNNTSARAGMGKRSVLDINANHRRPVSRTMSGEGVQTILSGLNARVLASMTEAQRQEFKFLVLDNNQVKVTYSSILVCYKEVFENTTYVSVYSLMVESSGADLQPNIYSAENRAIEVIMTPGDIYLHKSYWEVVQQHVTTTFGENAQILDAGCVVIPRECEKELDEARYNGLLHNATQALFTVMDSRVGGSDEPFTLAEVGASDQLTARVEFSNLHDVSLTGLPVRSDICLTMFAQSQTDPQFGLQQSRELTRVTGYIDLMYQPSPQLQQPQQYQYGQPPQIATQMYQPRLVLTGIDTATDAVTMELQLLALVTSMLLARNNTWRGTFRGRHYAAKNEIDLKDIGALGYEVNLTGDPHAQAQKIDTKADAFGDQQFDQFMNALIGQQLVYSMDIEEAGELGWIHQSFIAAANGNEDSRKVILQAANNLTLGNFSQIFDFNGVVCYDDKDRIHLGYYTDSKGAQRDIRELDYLAIMNLAGADEPGLVEKWEATHRNLGQSMDVRLHDRKAIMDRLISGTIHVKGFAQRVSFDHNFLTALSQAVEKAGLIVRPGNLAEAYSGASARGGYDLQHLLVNNQVGGFFSYGNNNQVAGNINQPFMGRHGRM